MKIAVCGKGGSGKSTVTTLLAKELAGRNKKVLVIDSDESNYGLSRQMGVDLALGFYCLFWRETKSTAGLQGIELSNGYPAMIRLADFLEKCGRRKKVLAHAG